MEVVAASMLNCHPGDHGQTIGLISQQVKVNLDLTDIVMVSHNSTTCIMLLLQTGYEVHKVGS